jgi:hypothetical protein
MAEQRPVAILIDDVPWADDFSLRFLAYLAEKLDNAHVALVVVVRTGDPGAESELVGHLWESASVPTIRPAELSESAVADLLAVSLPCHEVDPDLVRTVFEDTRGNPLLVVAVADAIATGEDADLTTPESVRRHIARRLGRLHPVLRQFVKAASVLGDNAAFVDVTRLANLESDQGLAAAEQLAAAEVLASTEPIAFAHRLVRTATYDFLSPAERTALHERAARQLSANRAQPETVAEHLMLCGPIHEPWALAVLHAAGCAVARKGAHAAAVRYLRRAVDGADLGAVAARVLIDLGLAEAAAGEPTSLDRFEHALDLVSGLADRADALYSLGQTLYRIGRYAEAGAKRSPRGWRQSGNRCWPSRLVIRGCQPHSSSRGREMSSVGRMKLFGVVRLWNFLSSTGSTISRYGVGDNCSYADLARSGAASLMNASRKTSNGTATVPSPEPAARPSKSSR